ncbi:hypothetical protein DPX16_22818 [Anabarilius grahami]|uniref:Uncharacterized protein n=1 Tax=Anabarilius grahami TaxID=495550 RepID=A0A3N0ZAK6_ANAGA|nr:hypothetical protein DPX16_22818 [Anabarilius grahami]
MAEFDRFPGHGLEDVGVEEEVKYYAAFTPPRIYRNLEITTHDVIFGAVHVFGLGIMHFHGTTINTYESTAVRWYSGHVPLKYIDHHIFTSVSPEQLLVSTGSLPEAVVH